MSIFTISIWLAWVHGFRIPGKKTQGFLKLSTSALESFNKLPPLSGGPGVWFSNSTVDHPYSMNQPKKYVAWFFFAWIWLIGWFMIWLFFPTQPWFKIMVSWCFMVSSALTYHLRFETSENWPMDLHGFPLREFLPCETEPPTTGHGTLALIKGKSSCKFRKITENPG